jgi:hypothetical protein
LALACATRQRIPIDCVPEGVTVYLDGEALDGVPESLDLDAGRPHTLYFKGEETIPELVVLKSTEVDGKLRLLPAEVCVHPHVARARRSLHVEIAPEASADGGDDPNGVSIVDVESRPDFVPFSP